VYNQDLWKISEEDGQVVSTILSIRKIPCNSIQPGGGGGGMFRWYWMDFGNGVLEVLLL